MTALDWVILVVFLAGLLALLAGVGPWLSGNRP